MTKKLPSERINASSALCKLNSIKFYKYSILKRFI